MVETGHDSDKHWLEGSMSKNQVVKRFGDKWILAGGLRFDRTSGVPSTISQSLESTNWGAHE